VITSSDIIHMKKVAGGENEETGPESKGAATEINNRDNK
jgi:hypothetical protein